MQKVLWTLHNFPRTLRAQTEEEKKKSKWRKKKKHPINNFKTMQDSVSNP